MSSPVKLYNHAVAPNPRRVRIFAAEKGVVLVLEDVDILAGQSRTPEFLAKNSSGGVPVLELDDGSYLSESVAICRYLEGLYPERFLPQSGALFRILAQSFKVVSSSSLNTAKRSVQRFTSVSSGWITNWLGRNSLPVIVLQLPTSLR